MSLLLLHPLLQYSQHREELGHCCPLLWDLREPPRTARHVSAPDRPLSERELAQYATSPPVSCLRVTCGIFPEDSWVSEARNRLGVTVGNVLDAIFETANTQITHPEWNRLCPKQQNRVNVVFDARWRRSAGAAQVRARGVLRSDCMLRHVLFSGLSLAPEGEATYLLTLKRPKPRLNIFPEAG
ncbi:ectomycorrhiza-regulated small secreted protein [Mycena albidolilacea]|uniref:Ectomycorrhiza-regulated small secreted protein n=1 Tax=Mycena albidolilacea TaxID=1033008 RepID=A0AAD6ZFN1_9AGAR|nr:ectomycorrhiza-regulated small secreted protein [Mycena albidolilacea]